MKKLDFEELKFVDSFVAFLDVLGFSKLVYSNNQKELQKINFYFTVIEGYLDKLQEELEEINQVSIELGADEETLLKLDYILISDSIIITVKMIKYNCESIIEENKELIELDQAIQKEYNILNRAAFEKLCETIVKIQRSLASFDIWLRGAISAGTTHISTNKKQIIGKAYIEAYKLEEKAKYPRVILDKQRVFDALNLKDEDELMQSIPYMFNWHNTPFKKSIPLFLDYIYYTAVVCDNDNRKQLNQIIDNILKNYENSKFEKHHDKFVWLLEYIIICLERGNKCYDDLLRKLK